VAVADESTARAPLLGTENVTVAPGTATPTASRTIAVSASENGVVTRADCAGPDTTVMLVAAPKLKSGNDP